MHSFYKDPKEKKQKEGIARNRKKDVKTVKTTKASFGTQKIFSAFRAEDNVPLLSALRAEDRRKS